MDGATARARTEELAKLIKQLRPELVRYARRRGAAPELAEDLVQEAVCRAIQSDIEGSDLRPWLHVVVRNLLTDHRRKSARHKEAIERFRVHRVVHDHSADVIEAETARSLQGLFSRLPSPQADVLGALCKGETLRSFAGRRGLSIRAAEGHLRRARRTMRDAVAE